MAKPNSNTRLMQGIRLISNLRVHRGTADCSLRDASLFPLLVIRYLTLSPFEPGMKNLSRWVQQSCDKFIPSLLPAYYYYVRAAEVIKKQLSNPALLYLREVVIQSLLLAKERVAGILVYSVSHFNSGKP
jgi:hypothetical protein